MSQLLDLANLPKRQKPSLGRIVHVRLPKQDKWYAAIVCAVIDDDVICAHVFMPGWEPIATDRVFHEDTAQQKNFAPREIAAWRWPPPV